MHERRVMWVMTRSRVKNQKPLVLDGMRPSEKEDICREVARRVGAHPLVRPPEADGLARTPVQSGLCLLRAVYGVLVLGERGHRALLQAGDSFWPVVRPEEDDGVSPATFGYEWSPGEAMSRLLLMMGGLPEVHVWIGIQETQEIIDFAAGFFPEQAERMGIAWKADPPPRFLWGRPPDGAVYRPVREATGYALWKTGEVFGGGVLKRVIEIGGGVRLGGRAESPMMGIAA